MYVLGIETTCDETSCSIVQDGTEILSLVTFSQEAIHAEFGGVVPEIASRNHIEAISWVVEKALTESGLKLSDIDRIAVANGPGLVGSLFVGINYAQGLGLASNIPVVEVNHIEAHLYAAIMTAEKQVATKQFPAHFPALGVVLSGGHTSIVLIHEVGKYQLIGQTIDDAIGEAFDKVAKMLSLPYPGGPNVEKMALNGNPKAYPIKKARVKDNPLALSFSGMKTAVLYTLKEIAPTQENLQNLCASFQRAAIESVYEKIELALTMHPVKAIYFGGGVTRNKTLRTKMATLPIPCFWPKDELCLDNAAMIAGLGFFQPVTSPYGSLFSLAPKTRIMW